MERMIVQYLMKRVKVHLLLHQTQTFYRIRVGIKLFKLVSMQDMIFCLTKEIFWRNTSYYGLGWFYSCNFHYSVNLFLLSLYFWHGMQRICELAYINSLKNFLVYTKSFKNFSHICLYWLNCNYCFELCLQVSHGRKTQQPWQDAKIGLVSRVIRGTTSKMGNKNINGLGWLIVSPQEIRDLEVSADRMFHFLLIWALGRAGWLESESYAFKCDTMILYLTSVMSPSVRRN